MSEITYTQKMFNQIINKINLIWSVKEPTEENIEKWSDEVTEKIREYILSRPEEEYDQMRIELMEPGKLPRKYILINVDNMMNDHPVSTTIIFRRENLKWKKSDTIDIPEDHKKLLCILCGTYWNMLKYTDKESAKIGIEFIIENEKIYDRYPEIVAEIYRKKPKKFKEWLNRISAWPSYHI